MDTSLLCPSCGKPLAPDAPLGLCQECLLKAGFPTGTNTGGRSPRFVAPSIEELTAKFPQLEILAFVGQGGMGAVYKARQKQLNRLVALKILPPDIGNEPAFAERFTREARALAQLNHPGIVTLYEFGQADGLFYFLMEFVDGVNLRQLLRSGRLSSREALAIVPQICEALQFAHDQGIVHRDIKPENILLDRRGRVKVADFGLAKLIGADSDAALDAGAAGKPAGLTQSGKVMGTPSYMAPEQVSLPSEVDHRADIYALGVVFYQMLTGELPARKIELPSKKVQIDVRLDEVVLRAMEKDPARRYQHVGEIGTVVETISQTSANQPSAQNNRTPMNILKSTVFWPVAAIGIVIVLAICFFAIHSHNPPHTTGAAVADSNSGNQKDAMPAIQAWLKLMDNGDYGQSWETAADTFHEAVTKSDWTDKSKEIRQPLGEVLSRKLTSAEPSRTLPGMPDGSYIVAKFGTAFANFKPATETVTFALADDGQWKAVGYLIEPGGGAPEAPAAGGEHAAAIASAQKWLAGIDGGHYAESWTDASDYFRAAITQDKWVSALQSVRQPLGALVSRVSISAQQTSTMPGAPDGQYVVMQFQTSFANAASTIETVTVGPEQNGQWKASGYYIK